MTSTATPMMQQYLSIKAKHKDAVLFFRLGDFYEMFNDDAIEISKLLNLTLTQRAGNPMCGIPYHASKIYIARLLRAGKKIAICEQIATAVPGELTERRVIEVITPGTAVGEDLLEQGCNNYLAALYCTPKPITHRKTKDFFIGFAYIDVSTGDFFALSFPKTALIEEIKKELGKVQPRELLIQQSLLQNEPDLQAVLLEYTHIPQNSYPDWAYAPSTAFKRLCACFGTENLKPFDLTINSPEVPPAGLLLQYLEETTGNAFHHITGITVYSESDFVIIDDSTRKNLELTHNLRDGTTAYTLFETLCHTKTAMGTRLLRHWLNYPLRHIQEITTRLQKTASLYRNEKLLAQTRQLLATILDIYRLAGRVSMKRAHGKDLLALKQSLHACLQLYTVSQTNNAFFMQLPDELYAELTALHTLLDNSIAEDCPTVLTEGGLIKSGWSEKLDNLRSIQTNAHQLLENYLQEERKKTGIHNLKIKYNRLMGYCLEVSKVSLNSVPEHFIRRRSLINAERFTTNKLNDLEVQINNAGENSTACERDLFDEVHAQVYEKISMLQYLAQEIAELDVLQAFAYAARLYAWVEPQFSSEQMLCIEEGRHPVVEKHLPSGEFIPNSLTLSSNQQTDIPAFALITGPNMAGKSTFLRQTALILILAQIGSFVPAKKTVCTPVDRIFCRVGAMDNLARGESTFLVEMTETAYILRNATSESLIIMDEVGRGTSTGDGLAIAQAVSEYVLNVIHAKTLFATHYHELAQLTHPHLKKLCLAVSEAEGKVIFLKKVTEGAAAHSYGIHVAQIAGLPPSVLNRAAEIVESHHSHCEVVPPLQSKPPHKEQKLFSDEECVINELLSINLNEITPLQALHLLDTWKHSLTASS